MICKNCNTENPEEAVFCFSCGHRLDGKISCPKCGTLIPDDFSFCPQCGTKVKTEPPLPEGQHRCVKCETVFEGNFCPKCGTRAEDKAPILTQSAPDGKVGFNFNFKKFLNYFGHGTALFVALFSVIFVFLAGLRLTGDELADAVIGSVGFGDMTKIDIYYFFGQAYEDIEAALSTAGHYTGVYETSLYLPVIFGTVISACMIVAVPVLFIVTIVRCIRNMLGKTEKTGYTLATATFFVFIGGMIALHSLVNIYLQMIYSSTIVESITVKTAFNEASLTGVILGSLFLAFMAAAMIAYRGKQLIKAKSIVNISAGALGVIFLGIVAGMLASPLISVTEGISGERITYKLNFFSFNSLFSLIGQAENLNDAQQLLTFATIAQFMIIILAVTTMLALVFRIGNFANKRSVASFVFSVINTLFAIVLLVFSLIYTNSEQVVEAIDSGKINIAPVNVILVFAILDLILSSAHMILDRAIVTPDDRQ